MRANRRMARLHKSAEFINENPDMSEKEKAASINKLMAKAESGGKSKKSETKLVVARGANRGLKGRPKGVKGRYKMVDPRMKKVGTHFLYLYRRKSSMLTSTTFTGNESYEARG